MGHVLDLGVDVAYEHEGYAAHVLDDGTLTSTYSREIDPRKTGKLRAACSCDWTGSEDWDVDSDDPSDWPSDELEDQILTEWEVHVYGLINAKRDEDAVTLLRVLRGFSKNADDLETARRGDGTEYSADVLKRIQGNLTYAAELISGMIPKED